VSLLVLPNGHPTTRQQETLTREEVALVTRFEEWCSRRGIVLDLICRKCLDDGLGREARLAGDNTRNSVKYTIRCPHADRVLGDPSAK
jgi:hypothetical protein